jgi:ElaB/YqjD/DUF883 family membrane-anchored ribosome-binding protein
MDSKHSQETVMDLNMHSADAIDAGTNSGAQGDANRALAKSKDELMKDFRNLIRDGEALLRSTSNLSGEAFAQAREQFRLQLANARTRVAAASRIAAEKSRQAALVTDDYVHANPWPAIGVAAGVGFVLGALFARR